MAFQEGTETITCPHCGAKHEARWYRLPVRDRYSIKCQGCGGILAEGKGLRDYLSVRMI